MGRPRLIKAGPVLLAMLLSLVVLASCTGRSLISWGSGWTATAASEGVVYVGTRQGQILAIDATSSARTRGREQVEVKWRFAPEEEGALEGVFGMPATGKDFIYVADRGDRDGENGKLYALRKDRDESGSSLQTNRGEWKKDIPGAMVGGPALAESEGLVIVASDDNNIYAFDGTGDSPGKLQWRFSAEGQIWSTPTVGEGALYFGSMDRHVYALSLEDGLNQASRLMWKYKTDGAIVARPLFHDGMVIVGSFDKNLYALDAKTGAVRWSFKGDDWIWAGAVTDGEQIIAATMEGTVYALDKDGGLVWSFFSEPKSPIVSTPVVVGDEVVVASDSGKLHLLSAGSGEKLEVSKDLDGRIKAPLTADGDMVFVGVENSTVHGVDVEQWVEAWQISTKE